MPPRQPATPAATLIVFRRAPDGGPAQLLMLDRAPHMRFAPGATVFPGGRVDPADQALAEAIAPEHPDSAEVAARIAAIRETLEETGLVVGVSHPVSAAAALAARECLLAEARLEPVLERFGWTLALDRLVPFARWCPDFERAFDTRFYLADLGTGAVELAVDGTENSRLFWSSAADLLEAAQQGTAQVIFPTVRNLERLAGLPDFATAAAHAAAYPIVTITPWREERDGVLHLTIPEGLGYPVTAEPLTQVHRG
ncbi:MAG: NUDIX domain-containing protein [Sphingomonadales bacterium]|nr:NUDIX domain-containing protein [Sphingomonadales bacterium]